jgi:hypothetical protein
MSQTLLTNKKKGTWAKKTPLTLLSQHWGNTNSHFSPPEIHFLRYKII